MAAAFAFGAAAPFVGPFLEIPGSEARGGGVTLTENVPAEFPAELGVLIAEEESGKAPKPVGYVRYAVSRGETISGIAESFGLAQDTLLSVNSIKNARLVQIGQVLMVPNQDGILHVVKKNDSLEGLAGKFEIEVEGIRVANGLTEETVLKPGDTLFLPEARLARVALQEINGDLFKWPVRGYVSSRYGWRTSPFTGARQFHSGLDIAAPHGNPVRAAMAGRVASTGFDVNSGNYVVLAHHSGYRTFYGHLDVIRVRKGEFVKDGERIGDVGSTGLSTGSHVHFTVFKYGSTVNPINLIN